jgi:hypothetical protein
VPVGNQKIKTRKFFTFRGKSIILTAMRKISAASILILIFCLISFWQDSNCPVISVTGPASIPRANEPITFTVNIDEKARDLKLEYVWSVDKGEIISGQEAQTITVKLGADLTIYATVEIKGLPEGCPNIFSETGFGDPVPEAVLIEEMLVSGSKIDAAKFDKLIGALKNDSDTTAYIIIHTAEKTSKKRERKEKQIREYLAEKNVPKERIVIVNGGENKDLIRLWFVPVGARPPIL